MAVDWETARTTWTMTETNAARFCHAGHCSKGPNHLLSREEYVPDYH